MQSSPKKMYLSEVQINSSRFYSFLKPISAILVFGLATCIAGCSDGEKTAGGGSSGTEAGNAITARIMLGSAPAAMAKVKLIDQESLDFEPSNNSYSAYTDNDGNVTFRQVVKGKYTLEAALNNEALQTSFTVDSTSSTMDLGTNTLQKTSTISGFLTDASTGKLSNANGVMKVRGLDHETQVVNGQFTLNSMPAGPASLVYIPAANETTDTICGYTEGVPGETVAPPSFANEKESILFEDFEDRNKQHRLGPVYTPNGGWWFLSSSGNAVISYADETFKELELPLETVEEDTRIHFTIEFPENNPNWQAWANLGVQIGDKGPNGEIITYDISSIDSITFDAAGNGNVILQFIDESRPGDNQAVGQAQISLNKDIVHYAFRPADISGGKENLKSVNLISWVFKTNAEFILDNIKLVGADKNAIWNK